MSTTETRRAPVFLITAPRNIYIAPSTYVSPSANKLVIKYRIVLKKNMQCHKVDLKYTSYGL